MGNLGSPFRLLEIVSRNINAMGASGKVLDRNEKYVLGNWRDRDLVIQGQRSRLHYVLLFYGK